MAENDVDISGVMVLQVREGRVPSIQQYFENSTTTDEFWA